MKDRALTQKLWFRLFLKVAVIMLSIVLLIMVCNTLFLDDYYISYQKRRLIENKPAVTRLNLNDAKSTIDYISDLYENHSIETEIYSLKGATLYTTYGGQMADFLFGPGETLSNMQHSPLMVLKSEKLLDGSVIERAKEEVSGTEYLVYRIKLSNHYVEMRTRIQLMKTSAAVSNNFITLIIIACIGVGIIAAIFVSYRSIKPIAEMNIITKNMAALDFSEKISEESKDEIGELAESINNLSDTLDNTLKDLRDKNRRLENEIEQERNLDKMRKNFVANVSHELKTPISIVSGYAEALKENIDNSKKDMYCETIIDETKRMNKLVLSLLNLSKFEANKDDLNITKFDIKPLCENMAKSIVKTDLYLELISIDVLADRDLIEQVLKSYLENAVAHATGKILVKNFIKDERVVVEIYNDGEKIDKKIMPHIWQSFYRGDTSHKRDKTRFGLGLSIVSAICKKHGEDCGVYNLENGVTFFFTLKKA